MELLPCPFCGGEALPTAHLTYNWFAPVCGRCNARGPSVKIERDSDPQEMRNLMNQADENWNRRASPASAPEGFALVPVVPTHAILDVMFNAGIDMHDVDLTLIYRAMLAAAPTPPSTEDRKDAEHEDYFADACRLALELECLLLDCKDTAITAKWWESAHEALEQHRQLIVAMQEDKP